jgi:hypothetical protein
VQGIDTAAAIVNATVAAIAAGITALSKVETLLIS